MTRPGHGSVVRDWSQRWLWAAAEDESVAGTPWRRRVITLIVILVGAVVLGASLRIDPGSAWFYPAAMGLALVWSAGAFASGPLHLGRIARRDRLRRPIASPVLVGLALAALFLLGALVVREIPLLDDQVNSVLAHAERGSLTLLVLVTALSGVAEELFFRGAVFASVPRLPVVVSAVAYALATFATGNVMLAFAAGVLGTVTGLERRASGGVLAPALTHVTWSLTMLFALPQLFG